MAFSSYENDYNDVDEEENSTPERHGKPWTQMEEDLLVMLIKRGYPLTRVATRLQRSRVAIEMRCMQIYDRNTKVVQAIQYIKEAL